jgi:hypothetical protein
VGGFSGSLSYVELTKAHIQMMPYNSGEGLCRCFRRDQHLIGGELKTGSNGPFVTTCCYCRTQRDKPLAAFLLAKGGK